MHQAAQLGDQFSCAYLIQAYQQGNLITGTDEQKAAQFKVMLENQLSEEKKPETSASSSYGNRLFDFKIKRKNEYLLGQDYARKNAWYLGLEKSLKAARELPCFWWLKKAKTFRFPAPETGLAQLISLFVDGNMDDKQVPLLALGLKELNTPQAYDRILGLLNDDFKQIEESKKSFLLGLVHDWAIAHNRQKELAKVYAKGMEDALRKAFCNHGDKKQLY